MFREFKEPYPKFNILVEQLKDISDRLNPYDQFVNPDGQISIQNNQGNVTDWSSGIGKSQAKTPAWEQQFNNLQSELVGTPVDEYLQWLNVPVYRTRIMVARPKSSYSIHKDYSPRLHLPLITNSQCYFVFKQPAEFIHMPADGRTYWVDTRREHTFMNGSVDNRLHLVMIVKE
jgi:hypothetical protein